MSTAVPTMTSMVAPGTASMYAAPATYAAAPTMASMYATPGASMYMPATTAMANYAAPATYAAPTMAAPSFVAAPQANYAAPAMYAAPTMAAPSFVAAPQAMYAAPTMVATQAVAAPAYVEMAAPGFAVPAPVSLTAGLVEPAKLEAERLAYEKALQAQLAKQTNAVLEEAKIKKAMLEQSAKTQLQQYQLQVEENLKMAALQCDQEAQTMVNGLREAAITQQTAQEERAAIAVCDYNKKKALEEMSVKSYQLQKQWYDSEMKLQGEYQRVMQAGQRSVITSPVPQVPVAAPMVV